VKRLAAAYAGLGDAGSARAASGAR